MITTHLKMLIVALVSALALGGGVTLATAGSAGADVADRAGTCSAEKQAVKDAKKNGSKKDVKAAKKALKACKANSTPDPSETPSETPTDPPTDGSGTCVPVVNVCAPLKQS